jgi:hypothetical protein
MRYCPAFAVAAGLLMFMSARADTIFGIAGGAGAPFRNGNSWVFGQVFTVGAQNLSVSALGAYDAGANGFTTVGGVPVGLYDYASGALLTSTQVTNTSTLQGTFRFTNIAPVTLLSGHQYEVVSVNLLDLYNKAQGVTVSPFVVDNGFRYTLGSSLAFQGAGAAFTGTNVLWMPNLQVSEVSAAAAPLPRAAWGGIALLGALGVVQWRRRTLPAA